MVRRTARTGLLVLVALATLSLGSCNMILGAVLPDWFEYSGDSVDVENMYIVTSEDGYGNYDVFVYFMGPGLSVNSQGYYEGVGDYMYIWLTLSSPELKAGDYNYNELGNPVVNTIYWGGVEFDYNSANSTNDTKINGGTFTVKEPLVGDGWIMEWELNTPSGSLEGQFRGEETDIINY